MKRRRVLRIIAAVLAVGAIGAGFVVAASQGSSAGRHAPRSQRASSQAALAAASARRAAAAAADRPHRGGTLLAMASDDFITLDPGQAYDALDYEVVYATQRPLYSFKPASAARLTPDLAAGPPQISDGGHVVTVQIRHGVHFSPPVNREVTSADVAYAIERGANPDVATPYFHAYFGDLVGAAHADGGPIAGIATPNRYTIVFRLDEPEGAFFAQALSLPISAPVPREYALPHDAKRPSDYEDWQVATGPYMLANDTTGRVLGVGWIAHQSATLVRNPNWRAATDFRPAYLNRIEILLNGDSGQIAERALTGADALQFNPPDAVAADTALADYPTQIHLVPDAGEQLASLNLAGPFSNVNVRRALWAAVDRDTLAATLGASEPSKPGTHFLYPGVPGFAQAGGYRGPSVAFNRHPAGDLTVAREYMRRAGYTNGTDRGRSTVRVVGINADPDKSQAEIFDTALRTLGFRTSLRLVSELDAYRLCAQTTSQATVCPDQGYTRDFDDPATVIAPEFGNIPIRAIRAAISAAQMLSGPARIRAWAHIDRLMVSDAVAIPFAFDGVRVIESADVSGALDLWDPGEWDLSFTWLNSNPTGVALIV